jgi:tetratricopeptide (TPR) repeat protein
MQSLLKRAQKDFEKAISLDDSYVQSYINLACVFDLLGNPMAAIGKIKELPKKQQESTDAMRILAIAYYNLKMEERAEEFWSKIIFLR